MSVFLQFLQPEWLSKILLLFSQVLAQILPFLRVLSQLTICNKILQGAFLEL